MTVLTGPSPSVRTAVAHPPPLRDARTNAVTSTTSARRTYGRPAETAGPPVPPAATDQRRRGEADVLRRDLAGLDRRAQSLSDDRGIALAVGQTLGVHERIHRLGYQRPGQPAVTQGALGERRQYPSSRWTGLVPPGSRAAAQRIARSSPEQTERNTSTNSSSLEAK